MIFPCSFESIAPLASKPPVLLSRGTVLFDSEFFVSDLFFCGGDFLLLLFLVCLSFNPVWKLQSSEVSQNLSICIFEFKGPGIFGYKKSHQRTL